MRLSLRQNTLRVFLTVLVGLNLVACNATNSSGGSSSLGSGSDRNSSTSSPSDTSSQLSAGSQSTSISNSASSSNAPVVSVAPAPQTLPPLTVSGIKISSVDSGIEASGVTYNGMSD